MASHNIFHQTSWPCTFKENEVHERKHRLLVETTLTILIHGKVLKYFLGGFILMGYYLINRMSCLGLDNKISCFILFLMNLFIHYFLKFLDIHVSFRASLDGNGYKCFCSSLNHYSILAYVTFNESSLYFMSPSPCLVHLQILHLDQSFRCIVDITFSSSTRRLTSSNVQSSFPFSFDN